MTVSRETEIRLREYADFLAGWTQKINLVAARGREDIWQRHVQDCLQVAELIDAEAGTVVDLGSGAGLPGMVIAIARPELNLTCVESDARKAVFLREAARRFAPNALVAHDRAERLAPLCASTVTARALAPLPTLLDYVYRHLAADGVALLMKGRSWKEELEAAAPAWHFSWEAAPSRTDTSAVILKIGGLRRV